MCILALDVKSQRSSSIWTRQSPRGCTMRQSRWQKLSRKTGRNIGLSSKSRCLSKNKISYESSRIVLKSNMSQEGKELANTSQKINFSLKQENHRMSEISKSEFSIETEFSKVESRNIFFIEPSPLLKTIIKSEPTKNLVQKLDFPRLVFIIQFDYFLYSPI